MSVADPELDLVSLISRISQLEQQQKVLKKYLIGLKHQLDRLTDQFNNRPESQQLKTLQGEIMVLQEHFNQLPNLKVSNADTLDAPMTDAVADHSMNFAHVKSDGIVIRRSRRQRRVGGKTTPTVVKQSNESKVDTTGSLVSANAAETDREEKTDAAIQQTRRVATLSDEEFKIERIMLLLLKANVAEKETAMNVEELLRRYKAGEKDFTGVNLAEANLKGSSLNSGSVNLSQANLTRANLNCVTWTNLNLDGASLKGANISEANLFRTNLSEADLENADLHKINLEQAKLEQAKLGKANFSGANLKAADLTGANLSGANLSGANLKNAKLMKANLSGANLSGADSEQSDLTGTNLSGANLSRANLRKAKLMKANLRNANLSQVSLLDADLEGADLKDLTKGTIC